MDVNLIKDNFPSTMIIFLFSVIVTADDLDNSKERSKWG